VVFHHLRGAAHTSEFENPTPLLIFTTQVAELFVNSSWRMAPAARAEPKALSRFCIWELILTGNDDAGGQMGQPDGGRIL
jgi:hypothetical protein